MTEIWIGSIYLKDEGGYEIVIRALIHYKKRLRSISSSPELDGAPTFVQIVEQQAMKVYSQINPTIKKIYDGLQDQNILNSTKIDISIIEKALDSYNTDIQKALESTQKYYSELFVDKQNIADELPIIKTALEKINQFS